MHGMQKFTEEGPRWRAEGADEPREEGDRVLQIRREGARTAPSAEVTKLVMHASKAGFQVAVNWFWSSAKITRASHYWGRACQHDGL